MEAWNKWQECSQAIEKIIPPKGEYIDLNDYEEKEVEIDGETMTILVKKSSEPSGEAVVGTAIVGVAIVA